MKPLTRIPFLVLCALAATAVLAATTTGNLLVSATVLSTCVVTTTPVAFGNYSATSGSPTTTTGGVLVTCTPGTTYSIALDAGANASTAGNVTTRRLAGPSANYLSYDLFTSNAYTTTWGDGANGSVLNPTAGTGTGLPITTTAYGRIPAGQYATAGAYTDTVVATVTYN